MFEYRIGTTWYEIDHHLIPRQTYFQEREISLERDEGNANTYLYGDAEVVPFAFEFEGTLVFDTPTEVINMKNWYKTNFPNCDRLRYQGREWPVLKAIFFFTYGNDHTQAQVTLSFIPETNII